MHKPFREIMILSWLLLAVQLSTAQSGDDVSKPPAANLMPVTLAVVDNNSGEPVTEFSYRHQFEAPGNVSPAEVAWQPVKSNTGTTVIQAPRSCRLRVELWFTDLKAGSRCKFEFIIRSTDNLRRFTARLERGITVRGIVRDARTRKPIAGAIVTPRTDHFPPRLARDIERPSTTDASGRFVLFGADPKRGVRASHPAYDDEVDMLDVRKSRDSRFDIYLKPTTIADIHGTVCDADGKPLEGVTVAGEHGTVQSARDGAYTISGRGFRLAFSKDGYVTRKLEPRELHQSGFVTLLDRQVYLKGKVLAADGRPVESFRVLAGQAESKEESWYLPSFDCAIKNREGRFVLGIDQEGKTWFGVRASGHAIREIWADVSRSDQERVIRLEAGVKVSGKIRTSPGANSTIQAHLILRRDADDGRGLSSRDTATNWAASTTTVQVDGTLTFDHVRPDRYTLELSDRGVTRTHLAFDVPAQGLEIGEVVLLAEVESRARPSRTMSKVVASGPSPTEAFVCPMLRTPKSSA